MVADILLSDLADRQVIVLTHDRDWFSELRARLPSDRWKSMILRPWQEPVVGIQWSTTTSVFDDARHLVGSNNEAAGNRARAAMDNQLSVIAERVRLAMPHMRYERNDHRMALDFLNRLVGERGNFRKRAGQGHVVFEEPPKLWEDARSLLIAWANPASHTGTLTNPEVEKLIDVCEATLKSFTCQGCGDPVWMADVATRGRLQCTCGELQWRY
jgi:hypothetical protein